MKMAFIHQWPKVVRFVALALFLTLAAAMVISYRNQHSFISRGREVFPEYTLSRDLVSVTENIEHSQLQGDRTRFLLKASRDELYVDGHHELKDVSLEVYGENEVSKGWIRAENCIYDQANGVVIFKNHVIATTFEKLSLKTERLTYEQTTGIIRTDDPVTFERPDLTGDVVGVEVRTRVGEEKILFKQHVNVTIQPKQQSGEPIRIQSRSGYAVKAESTINLIGEVSLAQAAQSLAADRMVALFDSQHQLQKVKAEGRAVMKSQSGQRASEVQAKNMEFVFDSQQHLQRAVASGSAAAKVVEPQQVRQVRAPRIEAEFVSSGSAAVSVSRLIGDDGRVEARFSPITSNKQTVGQHGSVLNQSSSEDKTLAADRVEIVYRQEGRELDRAMASGQAVLVLEPQRVSRDAERKTIRAEHMEVEFYGERNLAKAFTADGQVRVEFEPLEPNSPKPKRATTSQKLAAQIDRASQDFTQLTQSGDFHFVEGDREAKSEVAVYNGDTHVFSLRGGEPVVWDSRGRTRAEQIDMNMESGESVAQGGVVTTYYNQEATNQAAPFQRNQSPVFIAANRAEVKHAANLAIYIGNARAWQDDHYVTADRIELHGKERMTVAIGQVKSQFYRAPSKTDMPGSTPTVPVFASSQRMTYIAADRFVRYDTNVQLQQGTARLSADRVTVYLKRELNEVEKAVAEGQVIVTEPGRRAYGEQAVYTAQDERIVLTGQPARVEDDRYEAAQRGPRLTYLMGNDKVMVGDNGGAQRVKSVRKIP